MQTKKFISLSTQEAGRKKLLFTTALILAIEITARSWASLVLVLAH
jgi:hypothetical protein